MSLRVLIPAVVIAIAMAMGTVGLAMASSPAPVQVTGAQLESALLPAADFGQHAVAARKVSSGSHLTDKPAVDHIATMSCDKFLGASGAPRFGQTAYAGDVVFVLGLSSGLNYSQSVFQFARSSAAMALYDQIAAANARCRSVTVRVKSGPYSVSETIRSVSKVMAGGHQALAVRISVTIYQGPGVNAPITSTDDVLYTADSVDLFVVSRTYAGSLPRSPAPAAVIVKLIASVQALR